MNVSYYPVDSNRAILLAIQGTNQSKYLQPDYFLPASHSENYYSRKYNGNLSLNLKSKSRKIARVASVIMLSLSFLATTLEVKAQPNLESKASISSYAAQSSQHQPKKKPLLKRAAHKIAKHLGFRGSTANSKADTSTNSQTSASRNYKQPEITLEELKELYVNEYREMEEINSRNAYSLSKMLNRALTLRARALEARRADSSFAASTRVTDSSSEEEHTYSKPLDAFNISSGTTEYYEPWQDHDEEIAGVLGTEFSSNNQNEQAAPPLSAFSTVTTNKGLENISSNILDHSVILGWIKINEELLDRAYQDSKERENIERVGNIDMDESEWNISESEMNAELQEQMEELKRMGRYKEPTVIEEHEARAPDARYERVTATEEARQTMSRIPSKLSELRAIMEKKYATIAGGRVSQTNQQSLDRQGTSLDCAVSGTGAIESQIDDSGHSSPSSNGQESRSGSRTSSPSIIDSKEESSIEAKILEDKAMSADTISPLYTAALNDQLSQDEHYSSTSTSSYEYDTDADIRTYENVPIHPKKKKLKTRRQRRDASRYSYQDIDQGLASLDDSEFSDEDDDEWNKTGDDATSDTDGYDTVYTSSESRYSNDSSDEDDIPLPPPPTAEELAELETLTEPAELSTHSKVSNPDEVESANTTDVLGVADIPLSFTNQDDTKKVSVVADIKDITEELQNESSTASVLEILDEADEEDSLPKNISTNLRNTTSTEPQEQSTVRNKEELLKAASTIASSRTQARHASIIASHHIKHRMFERNMLVAVAAGDESESDQSQILGYSVWSSGAFGTDKQKASTNSDGYSSKILGGSIGADVQCENDLLLGASFSKIRSNVKHASQKVTKNLNTYIASLYGTSQIKDNLTLGVIGSVGLSPKPRSKLLSLESHLNYQIELPQEIKLIPNIDFKYEYERSKTYQEQIDGNVSIAHARKSYQALSTEIGSRVIFAPIKLDANGTSNVILSNAILTLTAHFSVERRIGSRGGHSPYHLTYQGNGGVGQEIGASTLSINSQHQKTSLNAGIGLIASCKNIKLEVLYDHTRQKRFKSHQGVLKLKVRL